MIIESQPLCRICLEEKRDPANKAIMLFGGKFVCGEHAIKKS